MAEEPEARAEVHLPHAPIMSDGGALKELEKLCSLTAPGSKATSKSKPIDATLDGLLATLTGYRERIAAGESVDLTQLPTIVEKAKKDVDARQQEVYTALTRYGKALDKVCTLSTTGTDIYGLNLICA